MFVTKMHNKMTLNVNTIKINCLQKLYPEKRFLNVF